MPALLHVYWILHFINVVLAGLAFALWWRGGGLAPGELNARQRLLECFGRILPWLCLGLVFWIPGVYLEFPADPWEHYSRINHWKYHTAVTDSPTWIKSSYFLAYSLIGHVTPPLRQIRWLDVYYTGSCLLLCWQYYRLARVIGLGERTSFVFVLVQALLGGNGLFGFYRYYGISSTLFAQLAAVAFIRTTYDVLRPQDHQPAALFRSSCAGMPMAGHLPVIGKAAAGSLLLCLAAFNHVQGLGIAALGASAVVVWRLVAWRKTAVWWLLGGALVASLVTIAWFPRHPDLDRIYRPQGWLTWWYGFNLFQPSSPAFARALAILGVVGIVNLFAGMLLAARNHIAGWLAVVPVAALCLPVVAIPMANAFAASPEGSTYILAYHRLLFAIPPGLSLLGFVAVWPSNRIIIPKPAGARGNSLAVLASLAVLVSVPSSAPWLNRAYHFLAVPPADLQLLHVVRESESLMRASRDGSTRFISPAATGYVSDVFGIWNSEFDTRLVGQGYQPGEVVGRTLNLLAQHESQELQGVVYIPALTSLYSPLSFIASLSRHWLPQEVSLDVIGAKEVGLRAMNASQILATTPYGTLYFLGDNRPVGADESGANPAANPAAR